MWKKSLDVSLEEIGLVVDDIIIIIDHEVLESRIMYLFSLIFVV